MKLRKKFLAVALSLAMMCCCGAGFSVSASAEDSDIPTVTVLVVCGTIPSETEMVQDAISEITSEKIGVNVELLPVEIGNYSTQLNLLLTGGDDTLDVYMALISFGSSFATIVNNGQALPLDDVIAPYEDEIKDAIGENVFDSGRVDGTLYGVGRLLDQASTACFNLRADIAEQYGYSNGDKVDLDELTELFAQIREDYPDTPIIGPMNGGPNLSDSRVDTLGDNLGVLANYGQDDEIINYYESDEFLDLVSHCEQWKDMGCYMADLLNVPDDPVNYIPAGKAFGCFAGHFSAEMNGIWSSANFGADMVSLQIYDDAVAVTPGAYAMINPSSSNPEAAAAVIYELATDPDVVNLMVNGIEGVDYQVLDDGSAAYVDGKDVTTTGWCMGYSWANLNSTLSIPFEYPADYYDQMLEANASAQKSKAFGCQFDLSSVADEVSACTNVVSQYVDALYAGAVDDYDSTITALQDGLRDAGIDEIIAVKQEQFDEFRASAE